MLDRKFKINPSKGPIWEWLDSAKTPANAQYESHARSPAVTPTISISKWRTANQKQTRNTSLKKATVARAYTAVQWTDSAFLFLGVQP